MQKSSSGGSVYIARCQIKHKDKFIIDSCGTGGGSSNWYLQGGFAYHEGDPSDERMIQASKKRHYDLTSTSRPMKSSDITNFDYIVVMDSQNKAEVMKAARHWGFEKEAEKKIRTMCSYLRNDKFKNKYHEVPDPWYGGQKGFETVLDLLEDSCQGLLDTVLGDTNDN